MPAICEFVDIAGLVRDAHKGEGLGNKFLATIREVTAIAHVVRVFTDPDVIHVDNRVDPKSDVETIETELALADLEIVKKRISTIEGKAKSGDKAALAELPILQKLEAAVGAGKPARSVEVDEGNQAMMRSLNLLSAKPVLYVANVDESELTKADTISADLAKRINHNPEDVIIVSAKIEAELAELAPTDAAAYLKDLGLTEPGLNRLIRQAFTTLGLMTFFTAYQLNLKPGQFSRARLPRKPPGLSTPTSRKHLSAPKLWTGKTSSRTANRAAKRKVYCGWRAKSTSCAMVTWRTSGLGYRSFYTKNILDEDIPFAYGLRLY